MTKIDRETVEALAALADRADGSEVLPTVLLGTKRADAVLLEAAATLRALRDALDEVQGALEESLDWMDSLRASGDAGFWDWSEGDVYYRGRAAIAKIKEKADE